ncbi:MAG: cytochrome c [Proteobacteria bacterium]|nr:cytochrome c [Pseudomonadota bacterium]
MNGPFRLFRHTFRSSGLALFFCVLGAVALITTTPGAATGATAKDNYRTYCAQCHGVNGAGGGVNTESMNVQPRDHTDAEGMSAISDAQLRKAISEGGLAVSKSVLMPPWRSTFSDKELDALVEHLRVLCKCSG